MNKPPTLPSDLAALLHDADHQLQRLERENPYRLYEFLYATAQRIAPVDAFYVCLYSEADGLLYFAYNVDGLIYEEPCIMPLGDGPTSRVVRTGQAVTWSGEAEAASVGGIMFGQQERFSLSAALLPLRAAPSEAAPRRPGPTLGVLSCHSYQFGVYGPAENAAFQQLADRAAVALRREQDDAAWRYRLRAAETQEQRAGEAPCAPAPHPQVAMAEEVIALLLGLTQQVEALRPLLPPDAQPLRAAVDALCRDCYRVQTHASQLPLRPGLNAAHAGTARLDCLTPTERALVPLLVSGKTLPAIADAQCCSHNTIKTHWASIKGKLGIANRAELACLFPASH